MKKSIAVLSLTIAGALGLAACGGKTGETTAASADSSAASSAAAGTEAAAEVPALSSDEYVFVKMNVPYADYYYGELKDVQPEAYSKATKAQLDKADAVEAAGFALKHEHHNLGSNSYSLLVFRKKA